MSEIIELKLKTLDSQVIDLKVRKDIPILELRELVAVKTGTPSDRIRLIYQGKVLKDDKDLAFYNVQSGNALHLVTRPPAGGSSSDEPTATTRPPAQPPAAAPGASPLPNMPTAPVGGVLMSSISIPEGSTGMVDLNQIMSGVINAISGGTRAVDAMGGQARVNVQAVAFNAPHPHVHTHAHPTAPLGTTAPATTSPAGASSAPAPGDQPQQPHQGPPRVQLQFSQPVPVAIPLAIPTAITQRIRTPQATVVPVRETADLVHDAGVLMQRASADTARLQRLLDREANLSPDERREAQALSADLAPRLYDLADHLAESAAQLQFLQMGDAPGAARSVLPSNPPVNASYPFLANFNRAGLQAVHGAPSASPVGSVALHVHANANELSQLPTQLAAIQHLLPQGQAHPFGSIQIQLGPQPSVPPARQPDPQLRSQRAGHPRAPEQASPPPAAPQQPQQPSAAPVPPQPQQPQGLPAGMPAGLNLPQLMQTMGPMMQTIAGGLAQQQQRAPGGAAQPNPFAALAGMMGPMLSGMAQPQQQQQPTRPSAAPAAPMPPGGGNLRNVIERMAESMGVSSESEEGSDIDQIMEVVSENLQMPDMIAIVGGNLAPLERAREPVASFIRERMLQGQEPTPARRRALLDRWCTALEGAISRPEVSQELRTRVRPDMASTFVPSVVASARLPILRFINHCLNSDGSVPGAFAEGLKSIGSHFIGAILDAASRSFVSGLSDVDVLIRALLNRFVMTMGPEFAMFAPMASGMVLPHLLRAHATFRASPPPMPTEAENIVLFLPSSESSSTESPAPASSTTTQAVSAPAPAAASTSTRAREEQEPSEDEDEDDQVSEAAHVPAWMESFSEEERRKVRRTMALDVAAQSRESAALRFSESYLSGAPADMRKEFVAGGSANEKQEESSAEPTIPDMD